MKTDKMWTISQICEQSGASRTQVDKLRKKLGIKAKKYDQEWLISGEQATVLLNELELPKEFHAPEQKAYGLHPARNPNWMMCTIEGIEGKVPVLVPRRFQGKLTGKAFTVERIEDINGTTWRHIWFARLASYEG